MRSTISGFWLIVLMVACGVMLFPLVMPLMAFFPVLFGNRSNW